MFSFHGTISDKITCFNSTEGSNYQDNSALRKIEVQLRAQLLYLTHAWQQKGRLQTKTQWKVSDENLESKKGCKKIQRAYQ